MRTSLNNCERVVQIMGNAGSQFAYCAKLVRLGHQLLLALAVGNIVKKNQCSDYFPVLPERRRVRFGRASRAVEAVNANLMLRVIAL